MGSTASAATSTTPMADDTRPEPTDRDVLAMLRAVTDDDRLLDAPPASLWAGIERRMATEHGDVGVGETVSEPRSSPGRSFPGRWAPVGRRWLRVGAVAAAIVVVGLAGVVVARTRSARPVRLAEARLSSAGLRGAPVGLVGDAEVIVRGGKQYLHVDASQVSARSGEYLELWLIDTSVKGMVSLGILDHGGDYELPPGLRYADFPVVDISSEPYDGQPTHSGESILRGRLA